MEPTTGRGPNEGSGYGSMKWTQTQVKNHSGLHGMWIKEQSKDNNMQKGTKQAEEVEEGDPSDRQDHSATRRVSLQSA
uniref:Uncharacterized protein n=1 Tax=Solanum tuberosum TaxID=4113 RepID=M1DFI3_SOLTU